MPETGYIVVCRDLHGGVGVFDTERDAHTWAMKMNSQSMRARMSGQEACHYLVVPIYLEATPEEKREVEEVGGHIGLYL